MVDFSIELWCIVAKVKRDSDKFPTFPPKRVCGSGLPLGSPCRCQWLPERLRLLPFKRRNTLYELVSLRLRGCNYFRSRHNLGNRDRAKPSASYDRAISHGICSFCCLDMDLSHGY
jgi:hypothetical protein